LKVKENVHNLTVLSFTNWKKYYLNWNCVYYQGLLPHIYSGILCNRHEVPSCPSSSLSHYVVTDWWALGCRLSLKSSFVGKSVKCFNNWNGTARSTRRPTHLQHADLTAFRRVRKIAKSDYVFRHACLSTRPYETTRFPLDGFSWNLVFQDFSKIHWINSSFVELRREYRVLYVKFYAHLSWILLRMRNVSDKAVDKFEILWRRAGHR
jgi:hypothetical protein